MHVYSADSTQSPWKFEALYQMGFFDAQNLINLSPVFGTKLQGQICKVSASTI